MKVVVAAAIVRSGHVLAARRTAPPALAGRWELPGGKVEPGETATAALHRELLEELGVHVVLGAQVGGDWPLDGLVLRVWLAELVGSAEPAPLQQHDALSWVPFDDLYRVGWLPGDLGPLTAAVTLAQRSPKR